jgi:hypothetical protein
MNVDTGSSRNRPQRAGPQRARTLTAALAGSVGFEFGVPNGVDPESPQFQSAQRACQKLMPGGPP